LSWITHGPGLITVIGNWFQTRFGFRISIRFWNEIFDWKWIRKHKSFISGKDPKQKYEAGCHDHNIQILH